MGLVAGIKRQSCSESAETRFCFEIFEIQLKKPLWALLLQSWETFLSDRTWISDELYLFANIQTQNY